MFSRAGGCSWSKKSLSVLEFSHGLGWTVCHNKWNYVISPLYSVVRSDSRKTLVYGLVSNPRVYVLSMLERTWSTSTLSSLSLVACIWIIEYASILHSNWSSQYNWCHYWSLHSVYYSPDVTGGVHSAAIMGYLTIYKDNVTFSNSLLWRFYRVNNSVLVT